MFLKTFSLSSTPFDDTGVYSVTINNYCPLCNTSAFIEAISLVPVGTIPYIWEHSSKQCFVLTALCPVCGKKFSALVRKTSSHSFLAFVEYLPRPTVIPDEVDVPDTIQSLSPRFLSIYTQTIASANYNLDELTGFGYRKSLEFLVKDYLISTVDSNNEKEKFSKLSLNNAIHKIGDPDLEKLMHGVRHGGNDETHYLKKYDFSSEELKELIELIMHLLDARNRTQIAKKNIKQKLENN